MLASIARALRLTLDERDHLFRLAGHNAPARALRADYVSPALLRVLDRLDDTPAQVVTDLGETLAQNAMAVALLGDNTRHTGLARSSVYRWFMNPDVRKVYEDSEHERIGRSFAANLRATMTRRGDDERVTILINRLLKESREFAEYWSLHEVGVNSGRRKLIAHPTLGTIETDCQMLFTEDQSQALLVFTTTPGSESAAKMQRLIEVSTVLIEPELAGIA
jgi:hypothetical protein